MGLDLTGKKVMVVGMALSGIGAAMLALKKGAQVTINDLQEEADVRERISQIPEEDLAQMKKIFGRAPSEEEAATQDYLILSPAVPTDLMYVEAARHNGVKVWSEIELASYEAKACVIGITGTNGKTTTTSLAGEIAKTEKPSSQTAGNIGYSFTKAALETPEDAYIALELSSFQLESIECFRPHVSVILNFTPDHLNRHHTFENYVAAKCRIFENQTADDFCVLNADDPLVREKGMELSQKKNGPRVCWFGRGRGSVQGEPYTVWVEDGAFYTNFSGSVQKVLDVEDMQIFGRHNEENAMAAICSCLCAGISLESVQRGLKSFKGVAHRIEPVGSWHGITFYNDSKATNPDAAIKGLLAMKTPKTVLIGGGYDKGTPYDDWCRLFNGRVRRLVLLGVTKDDIRECALRQGYPEELIVETETFEEAVKTAIESAEEGDSVLLSPACASWDMFKSYEQRGDEFRTLVGKWIKEHAE